MLHIPYFSFLRFRLFVNFGTKKVPCFCSRCDHFVLATIYDFCFSDVTSVRDHHHSEKPKREREPEENGEQKRRNGNRFPL